MLRHAHFYVKGRIADIRCKCEVGVRQKRELTFTLPKNSVSFCTAARRLGALFDIILHRRECRLLRISAKLEVSFLAKSVVALILYLASIGNNDVLFQ